MSMTYTVRSGPHGVRVDLEDVLVDSRVVQQPQRVIPDVDKPVKETISQPHTNCNSPHDLDMHLLAHVKET
jgi:hypothetical protein